MSYRGPRHGGSDFFGFPPATSQLVLVNVAVFLLQGILLNDVLAKGLALIPAQVTRGMVWELATYMFLHGSFMHILFNMFLLIMFGSEMERWWGSREFVKYYFVTGIGAGVVHILSAYLFGNPHGLVIGASGAVLGVLLAYGLTFPNRQILLWFVIPVSARTLVIVLAVMDLLFAFSGNDGVARFAHLGGMLTGLLYLKREILTSVWKRWTARTFHQGQTRNRRSGKRDEELQEEMNRILDKIRTDGIGSLSPEEKRNVQEWGERARRRQRGQGDG